MRFTGAYEGDVTAEELRAPGALKATLARPAIYVRGQLAASEGQRSAALTSLANLRSSMAAHDERRRQYGAERRENDVTDTANQLRFVSEAAFSRKALLNYEERRVFRAALTAIKGTRYGLACQVSMGEFIGSDDNKAHQSINAKRSDLLIYEHSTFLPVLVVEHQGSGHYQGNAEARDEVKRVVLERANVALLETTPVMDANAIVVAIEQLLGLVSRA